MRGFPKIRVPFARVPKDSNRLGVYIGVSLFWETTMASQCLPPSRPFSLMKPLPWNREQSRASAVAT